MPFRYANESDVLANLRESDANTELLERLYRIENALASVFDHKVGRSFGDPAVSSTRTVLVGCNARYAILQSPARLVETVYSGGTWDGMIWDGETEVTGWYPMFDDDQLVYGLGRSGEWSGDIRVTAIWASDSEAGVPEDVAHALTVVTIKQYRRETTTPGNEVIGPDGFVIPAPDPWSDSQVKATIEKYKVVEVIV